MDLAKINSRLPLQGVLLAFLAIFASKIVWFDLRTLYNQLLFRENIFWFFLAYSVALAPFIVFYFFAGPKRLIKYDVVLVFLGVNIYGSILGIVLGNDPQLIAQDGFKLLFLPAGYLAYRATHQYVDLGRLLAGLAWVVLAYQLIRLIFYASHIPTTFLFGRVIDVFPLAYFLARYATANKKFDLYSLLPALISFMAVTAGQKRTVAVSSLVVIIFIMMGYWRVIRIRTIGGVLIAVLVFVYWPGSAMWQSSVMRSIKRPHSLAEVAVERELVRVREVKDTLQRMREGGALAYLAGLGHGAQYRSWRHAVTKSDLHHTVHITAMAGWFRYGVLGLIFYAYLITQPLLVRVRRIANQGDGGQRWQIIALKAYWVAAIVASATTYCIFDDLFLGVFLGVLHHRRDQVKTLSPPGQA